MTDDGRRALDLADSEAKRMGHGWRGCEHRLLGLLADERGWVPEVLRQHGVTYDVARERMLAMLGTGASAPYDPGRGLTETPRASVVQVLAGIESERLGAHGRVGSGHILLALLTEGESVPIALFMQLGVDLARFREGGAPPPRRTG